MLKGISPLLTPDLLHALAAMGHGDTIAIVDANFPAYGITRVADSRASVISVPGANSPQLLDAVLSVLPIDSAATPPASTMEVVGEPDAVPEPVADFALVLTDHALAECEVGRLNRQAFYEAARQSFVIVKTGEVRPYGNILLVKGVVTA
ncbi:MAG TPA: RbsD/FucU domain-containing protein [Casimicrobiaceae bacterium]|nr:RbsD/FucU domain-containing protein [Casimicrobiaceae bacterium]